MCAVKAKGPVKVGIVGLGRAGYGMATCELAPRGKKITIVAGCDILKSQRDRFAKKLPKAVMYDDLKKMLADPNVELVSISTRSPDHVPHALLALKAGKDVFLEKPISLTFPEAKKLKAAAAKAKGKLYIRHNRRFETPFVHIREIIASGILGDVFEIRLCRHGYQRRNDWQTLIRCGGGQLLNWGPHLIDHALRFLESPVAEIWSDLKCVAAVGDAEDHVNIMFKGKNGRVVNVQISGGVALPSPVYAVHGSKGSLISENEKTIKLRYLDPKNKLKPCKVDDGTPDGFGGSDNLKWIEKEIKVKPKLKVDTASIWDYLYASIREGKKFPITIDEALGVMEVVDIVKKQNPKFKKSIM
jgi:predicted dehydrogenase